MTSRPGKIPADSRAILITEIVEMGGAERAGLALARWMTEQSLPVHIVTYQDRVGLADFADYPLEVVQLRPKMTAYRKIQALRAYFHEHPAPSRPLVSGYQPALHATLAGVRGFHTLMHDTPSLFSEACETASVGHRLLGRARDQIVAHGLHSGGVTIVTSEYLRFDCRRVFHVEAIIARMGGLALTTKFRPRPISGRLRMLSVSRIEANKRIDWVIRALSTLEHATLPLSAEIDWHFDVVGKGSRLGELEKLTRQLGLERRIQFQGFVSDEQLELLYGTAGLFVMPAVQGYGIPAIESLRRGIPVLLHRDSGVSDILLETPWATVFDGGEPSLVFALAKAVTSARENHHLMAPLPSIPTEDEWAEQVARLCNWL